MKVLMIQTIYSQAGNLLPSQQNSKPAVLPPPVIRHRTFSAGNVARQCLIFESNPSMTKASRGFGIALVELSDGRLFFFRTSLEVMKDGSELDFLLDELNRLPAWIANWKGAAEILGYAVGASLEFIELDPTNIVNWGINAWRQYAASWLAVRGAVESIKMLNETTLAATQGLTVNLSSILKDFISSLDYFALNMHNQFQCSWQSVYNFFAPSCEQLRLYRRQANDTFPVIVRQLFDAPGDLTTPSIIRAIDDGVPLIDFLSKLYDCPAKCVRHLNKLRFEEIGIQWLGRIKELLIILSGIDQNRLPNGGEWFVFNETVNLLAMLLRMPTTALSNRLLLGELSKLKWKRKIDPAVSFHERALVIERFKENIRLSVIATAWVNGEDSTLVEVNAQRIATQSVCALGLARLEQLSRKWRGEEALLDSNQSKHNSASYPVVLKNDLVVDSLRVIQLSPSQLRLEGFRMNNCVSSYSAACSSGSSYIFSVRNKEDRSCVTIEYQLLRSKAGMPELILVQQKGRNNSEPDKQFHPALDALSRYLDSSEVRQILRRFVIGQRLSAKSESDMTEKFMRSLDFVEFLKRECSGRLVHLGLGFLENASLTTDKIEQSNVITTRTQPIG